MLEAAIEACEMISEESRASLDSDRKLIQVAYDRNPPHHPQIDRPPLQLHYHSGQKSISLT